MGHPLLGDMLDVVCTNVANRYYGEKPWDITGPTALTTVTAQYLAVVAPTALGPSTLTPGRHPGVTILAYRKGVIRNADGEVVVRTKVPNYYATMYGARKIPRYRKLWKEHKVYGETS